VFVHLKNQVEGKPSIVDRIRSVCIKAASGILGRGEFRLELVNGTYWGIFKVYGTSGVVTYKTPLFRADDVVHMDNEYTVDDYENYCTTIFGKLDEIAHEEY